MMASVPRSRRPLTDRDRRDRGQSLVEFSLVGTVFLLVVLGIVNFGFMFEKKIVIASAANNAARYGATHSHATSSSATPPSNSIEGVVQATSSSVTIPNTDTNILIRYYVLGAATPTLCGTYSQTTDSITYKTGYTAVNCGVVNDLIDIKVSVAATFIAPVLSDVFHNGIPLSNEVATVIAQ